MSLHDDLEQAERYATAGWQRPPCPACVAISEASEEDKTALTRAFAGSIGINRLVDILATNGVTVNGAAIGRRTITRHREEEHTP